jgi:hypothetical protein
LGQLRIWFGAVETKFDPKAAVQKALEAAQRYCEVGIHIRDGGRTVCPTLTPREEDLLRRCILNCEGCVGVDLEPWAGLPAEPSKVLMGRFIMRDGREFRARISSSLSPARLLPRRKPNAKIFQQKLNHSRVV